MKTQTGIWIDGSKAVVISLHGDNENIKEITSEIENKVHHQNEGDKGSFMGSRHINNERTFDERRKHQSDAFLTKVIEVIKNDDELFIIGPASFKTRLETKINENHLLAPKLKGIESSDRLSLRQCVQKVKSFYKQ